MLTWFKCSTEYTRKTVYTFEAFKDFCASIIMTVIADFFSDIVHERLETKIALGDN